MCMATTNITRPDMRILFPCSQSAFNVTLVQTKKYLGGSEQVNHDALVICTVTVTPQTPLRTENRAASHQERVFCSVPFPRYCSCCSHCCGFPAEPAPPSSPQLSSEISVVFILRWCSYRQSRKASWQCVSVKTSMTKQAGVLPDLFVC